MKTLLTVLLFLFIGGLSYCQNWQTVVSNRSAFFQHQSVTRAIRIDSINILGNDSVFINYRSIDDSYNDVLPYSWNPQCHMDTSWVGANVIIRSNGDNVFVSENLDSIIIKPNAYQNDSWKMYQYLNGNYIEASIVSIDTGN